MVKLLARLSLLLLALLTVSTAAMAELTEKDETLMSLVQQRAGQMSRRVNFQGVYGNFLIFYDYKGDHIYLQFRRDKWDYTLDPQVRLLLKGVTYEVQFEYIGKAIIEPQPNETKVAQKLPELNKAPTDPYAIRTPRPMFIGRFLLSRPVAMDDLRF